MRARNTHSTWRALGLAGAVLALPGLRATAIDEVAGRSLVEAKCASCHALTPVKVGVAALLGSQGPDLSYVGNRLRRDWVEDWLVHPRRIRPAGYLAFRATVATAAGDRIDPALIPAHPRLEADEARAAAAFLATLRRDVNPYPVGTPNPDLRAEVHFEKILPCGACHQAHPGKGGVTGPELWSAGRRLDRDFLLSYVADPTYWTSAPMPRLPVRSDQLAAIADYLMAGTDADAATESPLGALALAPGEAHQAPPPLDGERGATVYRVLCSQCHGVLGNGKGVNAANLFVSPRDHTSYDEMSALSDERIFSAIKRGGAAVGKSALMPSWGGLLSDEEIRDLVRYLRRLSGTGDASAPAEGR